MSPAEMSINERKSINYTKLRKLIKDYVKPHWIDKKETLRYGGGETYIQEKVLKAASSLISKENLLNESKNNLINCLQKHKNLLAVYEGMQAKDFINYMPENQLKKKFVNLLYGSEYFHIRLREFYEWCKLKPRDDSGNKKIGINPTVLSYFLAIADPNKHAFCKPETYSKAVEELIGEEHIRKDPLERIIHCKEFYWDVLGFLGKYGLKDRNLFDVHSLFWCMNSGFEDEGSIWDEPNINVNYLILSYRDDSPWDDKLAESYHYATTVPNYKKVQPRSEFLLLKKNIGFVGHGKIDEIDIEDSQKDGPQNFRATFKAFRHIVPPTPISDEIKNAIVSLPGYNVQHSIKVVNKDIFDMVLNQKEVSATYWQIAPAEQARLWDDLLKNSIAAVGFSEINIDLSGITEDKLRGLFKQNYPDFSEQKAKVNFRQLWNFINLKPRDKFVTNKGQSLLLGLGIVKSNYKFRPKRPEYKHTIDVEYYKISESGIPIPAELKGKFGKTIIPLKKDDFEKIEALFNTIQKRSWIFQANSKYYDIEAAIRELKSIRWSIRKHRDDIKTGDTVYIWQSGKKAGIIGTGKIISNPIEMGIDEKEGKFIISPDKFLDYEIRADMEIKKILQNPINKEIIENHPTLKDLTILKAAMGTIFPLSDEQASAIKKLVNDEGTVKPTKYTKEDALKDLFITEDNFDNIMNRLSRKKNIIIQGPPGVGKTFIAKRLAYYLMTYKDKNRVSMIQFHQSYSYEDFIQGFRPSQDGKFVLRDGIFYDFCSQAIHDENKPWIFIIDEINRGNLSKIFGEMLMLIEADKRGPEFAVPLTYGEGSSTTFYIPSNVYLIGTMNTADRSLAMVDYALRRRFSFIDLEPQFNSPLFEKFLKSNNVQEELIKKIKKGMNALNETIADDTKNLGPGYKIGHSYFCPTDNEQTYDEYWYQMVITSEIKPLLKEYWFDDPKRVEGQISELLA